MKRAHKQLDVWQEGVTLAQCITRVSSAFTLHPSQGSPSPFTASQEDFRALKDVSFEVQQGDRIGIIDKLFSELFVSYPLQKLIEGEL